MATQLLIEFPDEVYNQVKRRAEETHRTIEAEIVEAVADKTSSNEPPSTNLGLLVSQLASVDNLTLRRLAKSKLPRKTANRIEVLHYKRQATGLNEQEDQELAQLMEEYSKVFVMCNQALGVLFDRGEDVSEFAPKG